MTTPDLPTWDVFVSHASEDKQAFVAPLARALSAFGVTVWFDSFELRPGDSLSRSIDAGLARSQYGLVVLSPAFMSKRWPEYELRGLTSRELAGGKVILPIWHNVAFEDVLAFSPPLADKMAIRTDHMAPLEVAVRVIQTIRPDIFTQIQRRLAFRAAQQDAEVQQIPTSEIHPGPIQHPVLSDDLVGRIRLVRAALLGVYTHSMDFWVDGFKRDLHPSTEVAWWEHVAAAYREYVSMAKQALTRDQHKAVFDYILALRLTDDEPAAAKAAKALPEEAPEIIRRLLAHKRPVYDIQEELPHAKAEHSEALIRAFAAMDKERFPRDVPEDLIRELLQTGSARRGDA